VVRYLGIDYGTKRVGIALSDGLGLMARPLEVVARSDVVSRVEDIVSTYDVTRLIIGLPTALGGHEGASAEGARSLLDKGMKRRKRREAVDKVAAAIILQEYLDNRAAEWNSETSKDVQDTES